MPPKHHSTFLPCPRIFVPRRTAVAPAVVLVVRVVAGLYSLMAQPPWHGARGGGRGRSSQWSSGKVRRDLPSDGRGQGFGRLEVRANVWTPAIAAAAAASSAQQPVRGGAVVAAGSSGAVTSAERPAASAVAKMPSPASMPPAVKARTRYLSLAYAYTSTFKLIAS